MKYLILIAAIVLSIGNNISAQNLPTDAETKKVTYTEAVTVDTLTKEVLFDRAKIWITTKSDDKKPEFADFEKGEVKGRVTFSIQLTYDIKYKKESRVSFDATINQKAGKYRYIFTNFRIYDVKSGEKSQESLETYFAKQRQNTKLEIVNQVEKNVKDLGEDLKKLMEKGEQVKRDDW